MPVYTDVMLDIESLALRARSVITCVGLVAFNLTDRNSWDNISKLPHTMIHLDFQEQINEGREISMNTILWWMRTCYQAGEDGLTAIESLFDPQINRFCTASACTRINAFINTCAPDGYLWGNGTKFDNVNIEELGYDCGVPIKIHYRNHSDMRTHIRNYRKNFEDRLAQLEFNLMPSWFAAHNPVHDCYRQILTVQHVQDPVDDG